MVFTHGLDVKALLDRVLGQQRRAEHHLGVGGVGARRDGRDHHRAMIEDELATLIGADGDRIAGPSVGADGRRGHVDGVVIGERQHRRVAGREALLDGLVELRVLDRHVLLDVVVNVLAERRLRVGQRDPVLRALRPGDGRHHIGQVQLEVLRVLRFVRRGRATCPAPWRRPRPAPAALRCGRSSADSRW